MLQYETKLIFFIFFLEKNRTLNSDKILTESNFEILENFEFCIDIKSVYTEFQRNRR